MIRNCKNIKEKVIQKNRRENFELRIQKKDLSILFLAKVNECEKNENIRLKKEIDKT